MKCVVFIVLLTAVLAKDTGDSYDQVFERLKENNYKINYNEKSSLLVLFYEKDGQVRNLPIQNTTNTTEYTEPFDGASFLIPTDEVSEVKITNFYTIAKSKTDVYCRIYVNYIYSPPLLVFANGTIPKLISAKVKLNDSRMEAITWDTFCNDCASSECLNNTFCSFKADNYKGSTCEKALETDKEACGLSLFVGWEGYAGSRYQKTYRNLPSQFSKFSIKGQISDTISGFESNWLKF
ncbi:hypothetical protein EIN_344840 [Entamoeba invadens IP1]|uniref:Uncharacterized protein n=1 Tax=Entamoeba invadens IP1 TaxID=370355 RepID=A0A0A1U3D8_ENTIV|nr:hypothetical protein EIN_344840 [Entamoeba invadens IP1]ELP88524.1 hypothetical protein EIN_344840 [Entamoeba invadens IP1]|eukprot:XP_004255295.1 hypothetical protein EIN_344840 [Entamoeba invadens IP1]